MMALLLAGATLTATESKAQVNVHINIGSQPGWGPTGYNHADYYYLPDINCYYDINRRQFIYPNGNRWVYASALPGRYRNVNLYNTYKVVINQASPFRYNEAHMRAYGRYKGVRNQPVIRDSRDERYYASQDHPRHNQWERQRGPDNRARDRRNDNRGRW